MTKRPPENLHRNEAAYALAIEVGNYRAACRQAISGLRRIPWDKLWRARLRGTFDRRNWKG